jgi:hypothetical protein
LNTYYLEDLLDNIIAHINNGATVFLKWQCPKCGDKITADNPIRLVIQNGEQKVALYKNYRHSERENGVMCDTLVTLDAKAFNYMVMLGLRLR